MVFPPITYNATYIEVVVNKCLRAYFENVFGPLPSRLLTKGMTAGTTLSLYIRVCSLTEAA